MGFEFEDYDYGDLFSDSRVKSYLYGDLYVLA
jgi:hypothetical protein